MVSDRERFRPRAFLHRHKLHEFGFSFQGPSELRLIWEQIKPMCPTVEVDVENPNKPKPTFSEFPHFALCVG